MSPIVESHRAFHRGTAPLFAILSAEQARKIAELQADATLDDRLSELAEKANEDDLSEVERAEYEGYIEANNLLAVLQAEARFHLSACES